VTTVRVWGSRGSIAASGAQTIRYGGNTSCVELRTDDGSVIVLDAGTGMRELGAQLALEGVREVHVLLSHLHLDHLQGLAFFAPLYDADTTIHLYGPPSPLQSLSERISAYMSDPLFPVHLAHVPSDLQMHDAPYESMAIGSATVLACPLAHRGPTVGWRIEDAGRSLVYMPDHEPAMVTRLETADPSWVSGAGLAHEADVLLHDAQYTEEEYPSHRGWGHSSIAHVVQFARLAAVRRLVLFHHDPSHSDAELDWVHARAVELWGAGEDAPLIAHDGMAFELAALGARRTATPA
jgi:phosphoribosyl 1,2-cyclic phosphodiesterase